jgi:hypothetical protein
MCAVSNAALLQQLFAQQTVQSFNVYSRQVFSSLHHCHTAALGVHTYRCNDAACHHLHHQYHSCGNRHCPNCGGLKKEQWAENLTADLLPTAYYHIVFTLPHELHPIVMGNRRAMFKLLFDAASQTLLQLAGDPQWLGGKCSITSVLHTWGQQLSFHPHVHCIVSGGGVDAANRWIQARRSNGKFLFPPGALKKVYKGIFLKGLRQLIANNQVNTDGIDTENIIRQVGYKKWKVHARSPFGNVDNVVAYLGRYTHKVAITAHRIINISEHSITFRYRDYADRNTTKEMTLSHGEFLRRFEQHILPKRFVKIRHYGLLQNHGKIQRLNAIRQQLKLQPQPPKVQVPVAVRMLEQYAKDITLCPKCKTGKLVLIYIDYGTQAKPISAQVGLMAEAVKEQNLHGPP